MKKLELKKYEIDLDGHTIYLSDLSSSRTLDFVIPEAVVGDEYNTKNIDFKEGDVVLDIGANVGSVSIMLAKKYPFLKIYAYEAHPVNYNILKKNIEDNNITNINAFNYAVYSADDHLIDINLNSDNTGASNVFVNPKDHPNLYPSEFSNIEVSTISFDSIISNNNISSIKLLKMDCEGSEFEILENSNLISEIEIENVGIEVHLFMEKYGKSVDNLVNTVNELASGNVSVKYSGL